MEIKNRKTLKQEATEERRVLQLSDLNGHLNGHRLKR